MMRTRMLYLGAKALGKVQFKMNRHIFRESDYSFHICLLSWWESTFQGNNLFVLEQVLGCRSYPIYSAIRPGFSVSL